MPVVLVSEAKVAVLCYNELLWLLLVNEAFFCFVVGDLLLGGGDHVD